MIYLASPYSDPDEWVRNRRYVAAREFVFHHFEQGTYLFSPIVYCHQFARDFEAPFHFDFWKGYNDEALVHCDALWVLKLDAWEQSNGVLYEIEQATLLGFDINFVEPLAYANF